MKGISSPSGWFYFRYERIHQRIFGFVIEDIADSVIKNNIFQDFIAFVTSIWYLWFYFNKKLRSLVVLLYIEFDASRKFASKLISSISFLKSLIHSWFHYVSRSMNSKVRREEGGGGQARSLAMLYVDFTPV